jgi:hypothetical protein
MWKKVGEIKFEYAIVFGGETIPMVAYKTLWVGSDRRSGPCLFFYLPWLGDEVGSRVMKQLGRDWFSFRSSRHCWAVFHDQPTEGLKRLVQLGWVVEPEKARTKLISALLLEENEEGSGSTLHARVPA